MAENGNDTTAEATMAKIVGEIKQDLDDEIKAEVSDSHITEVAVSAIEWAEAHPDESDAITSYEHGSRRFDDPEEYEHGTRD